MDGQSASIAFIDTGCTPCFLPRACPYEDAMLPYHCVCEHPESLKRKAGKSILLARQYRIKSSKEDTHPDDAQSLLDKARSLMDEARDLTQKAYDIEDRMDALYRPYLLYQPEPQPTASVIEIHLGSAPSSSPDDHPSVQSDHSEQTPSHSEHTVAGYESDRSGYAPDDDDNSGEESESEDFWFWHTRSCGAKTRPPPYEPGQEDEEPARKRQRC